MSQNKIVHLSSWQGPPTPSVLRPENDPRDIGANESRLLVQDIQESISDGFALYDPANRLVTWNAKFAKLLGYSGNLLRAGAHYEDLVRCAVKQPHVRRALNGRSEEDWIAGMVDCQENNGTYERLAQDNRWYLVSRRRTLRGHVAVVWTDITERKRAEQKVRESEERYRELFDDSLQGVCISSGDRILETNRSLLQLFQWPSGESPQSLTELDKLLSPEECKRVRSLRRMRLANRLAPVAYEFRATLGTGQVLHVQAVTRRIRWKGRAALQTVYWDVSEKRRSEEELIAKKLESIGAMARGIAFEFNHVFTGISSYLRLARMEAYARGFEVVGEYLAQTERAGEQGQDLIHQLLFLYRGGNPVKERTSLEELLRDALPFSDSKDNVVPLQRRHTQIMLKVVEQLWPVYVDRGQMLGVFRCLFVHGMQAMQYGGALEITASNTRLSGEPRGVNLSSGKYVQVVIKDEGPGMPQQVIERLFDPFFTSLENLGGLGLTSAYAVVKNHGGTITVYSKVGKGARLTVYLPAYRRPGGTG